MSHAAAGESEAHGSPASASPHAILFVFLTVLIDTVGLGIIIPVAPKLIQELTGLGLSEAAVYGGWLAFAYAFTQFLCGPIIGNLSDHFGRRPVLLASLAAFGLDYFVMGLAPTVLWLFAARVVAGIAGAAHTTAAAYVADVSSPEHRAKNFGLIGAAFGLGFVFGPAIGGLLGHFGTRVPFFAAAGLALANATYGWMVVPESLSRERRRPFSWKRAGVLSNLRQLAMYPGVVWLGATLLLWQLAHQSLPSTWTYYTMLKFNWDTRGVGASLAFVGIVMAIVQGGLTRVLIPRLGERHSAMIGLGLGMLGYVGYAIAPSAWMIYVSVLVFGLSGLVYPSINSLLSREVPPTEQGALQGAVASLYSLTAIVGPPLMTHTFEHFSRRPGWGYFPGASFALSACLTAAAAGVLGLGLWFRRSTNERILEPV